MNVIDALDDLQKRLTAEISQFKDAFANGTYSLPASLAAVLQTEGGIRAKSDVPYSVKVGDVIYSEITGQRTFELAILQHIKDTGAIYPLYAADHVRPCWGKWNFRGGYYIRKGLSIKQQIEALKSLNMEVLN